MLPEDVNLEDLPVCVCCRVTGSVLIPVRLEDCSSLTDERRQRCMRDSATPVLSYGLTLHCFKHHMEGLSYCGKTAFHCIADKGELVLSTTLLCSMTSSSGML